MDRCIHVYLFAIFLLCYTSGEVFAERDVFEFELRMKDGVSSRPDELLCHGVKLDAQRYTNILKFEPLVSSHVAHHMMVYGCQEPASLKPTWKCRDVENPFSLCRDGSKHVVYAWALDAPSKQLPEGVGFRVGGNTPIKYLVLQIHYKNKFEDGVTDSSGIKLHMTYKKQPFQAGYFLLGSTGYVPARTKNFHLESACMVSGSDIIYPFAYRTHSHSLGVVTSGYRIRNGTWTEIARMSPQNPQFFYNVTTRGLSVKPGDILAARCTMTNPHSKDVQMGSTHHDEMCNLYIMYYTRRRRSLDLRACFSDAQTFHWEDYFHNIPSSASSLDGVPTMKINGNAVKGLE